MWQPVATSSRSETTQTSGNTTIDVNGNLEYFFEFPEIVDYVGLPAAIFVSLQLTMQPVGETGRSVVAFDREQDWEMTIDVADIFSNADIQPQAITIFSNVAYLGCWLFGICQPADRPRIKVRVSAFWNRGFQNVQAEDQFGAAITEAVLDVQGVKDTTGVASACKTCGFHPPNSSVFTIRNARSNDPVVERSSARLADAPAQGEAHSPARVAPASWLGGWVKL